MATHWPGSGHIFSLEKNTESILISTENRENGSLEKGGGQGCAGFRGPAVPFLMKDFDSKCGELEN